MTGEGEHRAPGAPDPGWYPDPTSDGRLRWWNGNQWTDDFPPGSQPPPEPAGSQEPASIPPELRPPGQVPPAMRAPERVPPAYHAFAQPSLKTDGFAIAALVFGVLGGVVLSIIFAVIALRRIGRGERKGKGFAIAGLAFTGMWALVLVVGIILAITEKPNAERFTGRASAVAAVVDEFEAASDANDGDRLCGLLTPGFARAVARAGDATCPKWVEENLGSGIQETLTVKTIDFAGPNRATAVVEEGDDEQRWRFERREGEWKIADISDR